MEPNIAYISSRECHNRDVTGDPVSNHGDAGEMVSVVNYIIKALRIDIATVSDLPFYPLSRCCVLFFELVNSPF